MKKLLPFLSLAVAMLLTVQVNAQAKRYATFEHYTNASCGPCAVQNPVFETFYEEHKSDIRHITFHTVWPGTDPMNAHNPDPVNTMVGYHGVTGVPSMMLNGSSIGGPASVTTDMLNLAPSPVRINVSEVDNGDDTRTVTVGVENVGDLAAGDYILRVAAIEEPISYNSPPGSNGETVFPNVFRTWIANDVAVEVPAQGETATFEYTYDMHSDWAADAIYPMAYLVNTANKEVINAGTPFNLGIEVLADDNTLQASDANGNSTSLTLNNIGDADAEMAFSLTGSAPEGWDASFAVDGLTYTGDATIALTAGITDAIINVTPGANAGIGKYVLTATIVETGEVQKANLTVIHNVTDLIVVKSYNADVDILAPYHNGLVAADNNAFGDLSQDEFMRAMDINALEGLNNIYLSIGWLFPALSDNLVAVLEGHLDNGGNLLIAGQDIGWDVMSNHDQSNGTPTQQSFYTNYLHTDYNDDGAPSSNSFSMVAEDGVFGEIEGSSGINPVWGPTYLYPDQISAANDNASDFLTYNTGQNGAVRALTDNYKTVYFGIGLEHVGDEAISNQLVKLSHDWFYSTVSTKDFDALVEELSLGQNTPNPADEFTTIALPSSLELPARIVVSDITGKQVLVKEIDTVVPAIEISTKQLQEGVYFYQLHTDNASGISRKMIVTH